MNIELKGVSKTYSLSGEAPVPALREIDIAIAPGESVALMGPSGCGKTTLLSVIGLLTQPSGGSYLLDERDAGGFSRREQARYRGQEIGFVFQAYNLLPRERAWRNVMLPLTFRSECRATRKEKALEALAAVHLEHRARHYPSQMSGGEQQRVAIARALVCRPSLLVADEPTGNLDSHAGDEIMDLILEVATQCGASVIMATHDRQTARYAHRLLEMRDGMIVADAEQRGQK